MTPRTRIPPFRRSASVRPPDGAPNVLIILIDDAGFGSNSAFGGPADTPNFERLAAGGIELHALPHDRPVFPDARRASERPQPPHRRDGWDHRDRHLCARIQLGPTEHCAPLAETLKLNGYSTAQIGKCHEVPVWQTSPMGPFDAWPSIGGGFEYFYGFIGGETNQYAPALYSGTTPVEPDRTPEEGYHLTEDLADHAIDWIRQQKALMPDKPFFMYFAPGATHAPHHVAPEWSAKYKGAFDKGWDTVREETLQRQKARGVVPTDAELTARPAEIPSWDDMPEALKPVLARQMEVYAGFLEHTDHHVGRLLDSLTTSASSMTR